MGTEHGYKQTLEDMTNYCNNATSTRPLLLLAPAGGGKTAVMRLFLAHYLDSTAAFGGKACPSYSLNAVSSKNNSAQVSKGWRHKARVFLQTHFTCASATSTDPQRMLSRFCRTEIQRMSTF